MYLRFAMLFSQLKLMLLAGRNITVIFIKLIVDANLEPISYQQHLQFFFKVK